MLHENSMYNYEFVSERILTVCYRTVRRYTTLVALYSPEDGRKEDSEEFYEILQKVVININRNDYIIVARYFNACVIYNGKSW